MSNICKNCTVKNNWEACKETECTVHDSWAMKHVTARVEQLEQELIEIKGLAGISCDSHDINDPVTAITYDGEQHGK